MRALYSGVCVECEAFIKTGDEIVWTPREKARHLSCPGTPEIELRPSEEVCESCWLVKPCEC